MCLEFKKFCFVLDLRKGTLIVACICLVFEIISLILSSFVANYVTVNAGQLRATHKLPGYIYAQKFMIFVYMLLIFFKLMLGAALIIGWVKKLPDHVQMWYKGYSLCIFVQTILTITGVIKEGLYLELWGYIFIVERVVVSLITLYFIMVVRSYYFKLTKDTNYYQNLANYRPSKNGSNGGRVLFTDKEAKNDNTGADLKPIKFDKKGEVLDKVIATENFCLYSEPNSMDILTPQCDLGHAQLRPSMLYPSLV